MGGFALVPEKGWQGVAMVIKPYSKNAYVVLRDVVLPAPNWWSETKPAQWDMLGIRCWQSVEKLDFKVGDKVSFTNLDIDGCSIRGYPCDDGENGTIGIFKVIEACAYRDQHLINYEYTKSKVGDSKCWKDVPVENFESAMRDRLLHLFPNSIVTVREGKNIRTVCGGTHEEDFICEERLHKIASTVLYHVKSGKEHYLRY